MEHNVALFEGDVASPMTDPYITIKVRHVEEWLVEFESNLSRKGGAGRLLVKRTVRQLGPRFLWEFLRITAAWYLSVVWDGCRNGLDIGLLLGGDVGGWRIDGEVEHKELRLGLLDSSWERGVCAEIVVGDADGLLCARLQRCWQTNSVVLNVADRA